MGLAKASKMFNVLRATVKEIGITSVSTVSGVLFFFLSQGKTQERNRCAALNVANSTKRSVQANVKAGLSSHEVSVSATIEIYMTCLSNFSFQVCQICSYIYMF
jgi:hypothetical protein